MSGQPPQVGQGAPQSLPETKKRFFSEQVADIQKLREVAGKHAHRAMKLRHKASKYLTSMETYRYKATVMKEKAEMMSERIAEVHTRMAEMQDELRVGAQAVQAGGVRPREQAKLHQRIQACQEKIVKFQRKAAYYNLKHDHYLAVSSQKKVKADLLEEEAKSYDIEAHNTQTRADRLQDSSSSDATQAHEAYRQVGRL